MPLPEEPFECDVCKEVKMYFTKTEPNDNAKNAGLFSLNSNRNIVSSQQIEPLTAVCSNCHQVKFFLLDENLKPL